MTARRIVGEGLLHEGSDDDDSYLIGGRCPRCALVLFPAPFVCPRCMDHTSRPEPIRLSGQGTLDRFVVAERGPREFAPPYIQAYVELTEGPVIYTLIRGCDPSDPDLTRGQPMRVTVEVVKREGETDVVGWAAYPVRDRRPAGAQEVR